MQVQKTTFRKFFLVNAILLCALIIQPITSTACQPFKHLKMERREIVHSVCAKEWIDLDNCPLEFGSTYGLYSAASLEMVVGGEIIYEPVHYLGDKTVQTADQLTLERFKKHFIRQKKAGNLQKILIVIFMENMKFIKVGNLLRALA